MALTIYYAPAEISPDDIINKLLENESSVLLLPEQYTLYGEKKYIHFSTNTVLSFRRFAYRLFKQFGRRGEHINEHQKTMLLSYALKKVYNDLSIYKNASQNIEFATAIKGTINEFKNAKLTWEEIRRIKVPERKSLELKLSDISLIYQALDHVMGGKYYDSYDDYDEFSELLSSYQSELKQQYGNQILIIDKFAGFTKQELAILSNLVPLFRECHLFLRTSTLDPDICPPHFADTVKNASVLVRLLQEKNISVVPKSLQGNSRYANCDLSYLSKHLFALYPVPYQDTAKNIFFYEAKNRREECEWIARQIFRLVREKQYKLSEIAVCGRNMEEYESLLKSVFSEFQIPIFMDSKARLLSHSVASFLFSIDDIFEENYSQNAVFQFLKSEFSPAENIDSFENFCITYGVYGTHLKEDDKFLKKLTLAASNGLNTDLFTDIRNSFVPQLKAFREKTKNVHKPIFLADEFYQLLEEFQLGEKLEQAAGQLKETGELRLAGEYAQSYNLILDLVNALISTFEDTPITFHEFNQILKAGMGDISIGSIPPNLDSLILSDAERLVDNGYKVLFVIGLNEGVFPKEVSPNLMLSDFELELLESQGIQSVMSSMTKGLIEQQTVYKTMCMPTEQLYLSCPSGGPDGEPLEMSSLFRKAKDLFPNVSEPEDSFLSAKKYTFRKMLEQKSCPSLQQYFEQDEQFHKILQKNKVLNGRILGTLSQTTADKLYGNEINTSVSKLERYAGCPFSFHLKYNLKLRERIPFSLSPLDAGSFIHNALEQFFKKAGNSVKAFQDSDIRNLVDEITDQLLKRDLKGFFAASKRNQYLGNKLKSILFHTARAIVRQLQNSDFEVYGCELTFDQKGDFKPMLLNISGKRVLVQGKIDRCDRMDRYIRIIDYKSSNKDLKLDDVFYGLNIQLPLYLDAACKNLDTEPSAMLYMHTFLPEIKLNHLGEEIEQKIIKHYKMNGYVLGKEEIIAAMDHGASSLPAEIGKSGLKGNFLTEEEFSMLRKHVQKLLQQMAHNIVSGNISVSPAAKSGKLNCTYCPYQTVCHFELSQNKQSCRFMKPLTKEEIFETIKQERD